MPIYEYRCTKCGHITEAWQKFSDPPLPACQVCGAPVKKIISHNTFHLKGSGWYVSDYASRSSGDKPAKKQRKDEAAKPDDKGTAEKGPTKDT